MNNDYLTNDNYIIVSAHNYDMGISHSTEEFFEDLKRIGYIKKLITQYSEGKELKERLVLNHLIILNNVFGAEHLCRLLFLKLRGQMRYIKPFMILLNILPNVLYKVGNEEVIFTDLEPMDQTIIGKLRKI
ncbi:MAG: hypothetical protein P4L79_10740 [Legionella sp.]|uniref:DUF7207 family protein n=1 Tax=Legionella sp. TaxID=459 RepID=UPI00284D0D4F|nr:hypothetical protein [Legionella sp.]